MKLSSTRSSDQLYPFLSFPIALKWKHDQRRKQSLRDQHIGGGSEDGGFVLLVFKCQNILSLGGKISAALHSGLIG